MRAGSQRRANARCLLWLAILGLPVGLRAQDALAYDQRGVHVDDRKNGCDYYLLEPEGWKASPEGAAEFGAHMLLRPLKNGEEKGAPFITLRCPRKGYEGCIDLSGADLVEGDTLDSERMEVTNPWYNVHAEHIALEGRVNLYCATVDAWDYTRYICVQLSTGARPATAAELKVFRDLVASLCWDLKEVFSSEEELPMEVVPVEPRR